MKANEAPEKIWLGKSTQNLMLFDPNSNTYVEYTRTDAFIEKVARFLEYKLNDRVEIQAWGTLIPSLTSKKAFIEDVKEYLKGV